MDTETESSLFHKLNRIIWLLEESSAREKRVADSRGQGVNVMAVMNAEQIDAEELRRRVSDLENRVTQLERLIESAKSGAHSPKDSDERVI